MEENLLEFEIDFIEDGLHWIYIYDNDKLLNKIPIIVRNEDL